MQRRSFIKGACRICLLGATAASIGADLASCSPAAGTNVFKPVVIDNSIEIPLSLFDAHSFRIISPEKFQYEIAVEKKAADNYKALLLRCTHHDNQLMSTGNGFTCNLHGSKFDKEGNVLNGPAETALKQLHTQIVKTNLVIQL